MKLTKFISNNTYQSKNLMLCNGELAHHNRSVLGIMQVGL
jgi:hypothetical protein